MVSQSLGRDTSDNLSIPGTDANKATNVLDDSLPQQANGTNPVVFKAKKGTLDSGTNKQAVDQTVDSLKKAPHVTKVVSPYDDNDQALSKDKTIGYASVTLDLSAADLTEEEANKVIDATSPARDVGLEVEEAGYLGQAVSKPETESSEAVGLAAAVIILVFAFGSVTAMLLPIATAILGLATGLSLIGLLGKLVEVPTVGPTLATMIGLGVGIDYALFIVTRHKQQLQAGVEVQESVARAVATSGSAVLFAGGTVVIALVSMAAAQIPLVTALGYTAAVSVFVAVSAALTLLPALLGALGPRINSLRVHLGKTHPDDKKPHGWRRWARGVCNRPWPAAIASTAILLVLAIPLLNLQLGQTDAGTDPKDQTTRKAYDLLTAGFGPGVNGPFLIAVQLNPPAKADQSNIDKVDDQQKQLDQQQQQATQQGEAQGLSPDQAQQQAEQETASQQQKLDQQKQQAENPASDTRLTTLTDDLKKTSGVKQVSPTQLDSKGDAGVITLIPTTAPSDEKTADLVNTLRDKVIPPAEKGGLTADVGGQTAGYVDLADRISSKLPQMILIIIALSFIVLLLAFRSILLPLKAAFVNLLSVAAAYGVVTAVFQEGHGAKLIGLDGPVPIQSFVPLFMFAILFGLSMDYEVFLLSQVKEHYEEDGDTHDAVVDGLASTGRVITSAALIMVFVFSSFVLNGDPVVKQFGLGMAVAIAVDSTIVRCLLVPALMVLMRRAIWWLPRWLDRILPRISIEGGEYFGREGPGGPPAKPAPGEA